MGTVWAVVWTGRDGRLHEWHYGCREVAEDAAETLRGGWRTDARVETRGGSG